MDSNFLSSSFIGLANALGWMNVIRDNGVIGMMIEHMRSAGMGIANICLVVPGG